MSEIGELVTIALGYGELKCQMEHDKYGKINSQPAPKIKNVKLLRTNLKEGMSARLFDINEEGKVIDVGLQKRLDGEPNPADEIMKKDPKPVKVGDMNLPLSVAAHHILPGKDSLPKSQLAKYIWENPPSGGSEISSDIGFHIDGAENGVWLPTHQKLSKGMGKAAEIKVPSKEDPSKLVHKYYTEMTEIGLEEEDETGLTSFTGWYTQDAMRLMKAQYHTGGHEDYSEKIVEILDAIHTELIKVSGNNCEQCKKAKANGKFPSPHYLVYRLIALAQAIKSRLKGPPSAWSRCLFTSIWARRYKEDNEKYQQYIAQKES